MRLPAMFTPSTYPLDSVKTQNFLLLRLGGWRVGQGDEAKSEKRRERGTEHEREP